MSLSPEVQPSLLQGLQDHQSKSTDCIRYTRMHKGPWPIKHFSPKFEIRTFLFEGNLCAETVLRLKYFVTLTDIYERSFTFTERIKSIWFYEGKMSCRSWNCGKAVYRTHRYPQQYGERILHNYISMGRELYITTSVLVKCQPVNNVTHSSLGKKDQVAMQSKGTMLTIIIVNSTVSNPKAQC